MKDIIVTDIFTILATLLVFTILFITTNKPTKCKRCGSKFYYNGDKDELVCYECKIKNFNKKEGK